MPTDETPEQILARVAMDAYLNSRCCDSNGRRTGKEKSATRLFGDIYHAAINRLRDVALRVGELRGHEIACGKDADCSERDRLLVEK